MYTRIRGPRVTVTHGQALALTHRVIFRAGIVGIEKLLEPFQKLKVILKTTLQQSVNWYNLQKKKIKGKMITEYVQCLGGAGSGCVGKCVDSNIDAFSGGRH